MAEDNVILPGTGEIIATKSVDGVEYQIMLLADGTYTVISPATSGKQDLLLTELQKKADLTETQPVSATSLPLPSGAATSAQQLADGQVYCRVCIDKYGINYTGTKNITYAHTLSDRFNCIKCGYTITKANIENRYWNIHKIGKRGYN